MADPHVDIIARPVGIALTAPESNAALDLARSLQGVNDALGPALDGYAKSARAKASAKAEADALANSGAAFGEAVRSGKLRPTQNPWYIQAYEEKAAQVRAQGQVSQLASDSQTWAEKNDPQAFNARWAKEVGQLAQTYQGVDQSKGFHAAADPLSEQALNSNAEYNAQAIVHAHIQNTTTLMSDHLEAAYKANPKISPADLFKAIQPDLDQWHGTGGTEAQANELIRGAFSAAAASTGDGDLLDALKYDRGGKGSIYNMVAPNGDPYANDIEQAKYRIYRMQELQGMGAVHKAQAQQELEGYHFQALAYGKFGFDLVQGKVTQDQLQAFAQENNISPAGFQSFMREEARDLAANNTYASAQTRQYALTPGNQEKILNLRFRALTEGMSKSLLHDTYEAVRDGMDENVANDIISKADSTGKYFRSEAKADVREARAEANANRALKAQGTRDLKQSIAESLGAADAALQQNKDRYFINPAFRTAATRGATDMANAWLRTHDDDFAGASKAADDYLDSLVKQRIARLRGASSRGSLQGGNPRASH